ncbi:unnamed protein product [Fusarium venenatum]|uniref:Uncharacterized protein n=1 Tax=Fusarium venenatum TaxID=56646 RepID=A0A2L2TP47_9HYPO|nr:uncharacterized protein FVRRES_05611 [Fusarium venenatum]CEI61175.1 unnamed protein product [Fusarium venenatum]
MVHPFFSRAALPAPSHSSTIVNRGIVTVYEPSTKYFRLSNASNFCLPQRYEPDSLLLSHSVERLSCSPAPRPGRISLAKVTNNTQAKRTKVETRQEDGDGIGSVSTIDALGSFMQVERMCIVV